ncbi:MAG TPA: SRPBCC family protein, partial [Actinomycetota bacterium]|nr:SRPBCC family protein [Actinomycetota bacterium]
MRRGLQLAAAATAATGAYLRWVRPWELRWGATDEEVALPAPGDDLVQNPHLVSTRVVTVQAP